MGVKSYWWLSFYFHGHVRFPSFNMRIENGKIVGK